MDSHFRLSPEEVQRFRSEGFIVLDRITTDDEVERLRCIFDHLFSSDAGRDRGSQFDLAGTDEEGKKPVLPQILNPVEFAPELAQAEFRTAALEIAKQLLGPEAEPFFEHAILKPAGYGAPTPWHQDEAHRNDAGVDYDQISIWLPLQEATVENGCMEFVPGTNLGPVLDHRSPNNDPRVMALECVGQFDPAKAVPCPLPPGGATVHHSRTLHHAGANSSAVPRRAYILAFRGKERVNPEFQGYRWNSEKATAADARRVAWNNRGGMIGKASRSGRALMSRVKQKASQMLGR